MRRTILVILVLIISMMLISADVKPPKLIRVEIVNRSGEDITVSLVGMGYDFGTGQFIGSWGIVRPGVHYFQIPGTIRTQLLNGQTIITRLPEYIYEAHILRDLYILTVRYEQENSGLVLCLNNWIPVKYQGDVAYYPAHKANNKLIIKPCNSVPVNIGEPAAGITKWNKFYLILSSWFIIQ